MTNLARCIRRYVFEFPRIEVFEFSDIELSDVSSTGGSILCGSSRRLKLKMLSSKLLCFSRIWLICTDRYASAPLAPRELAVSCIAWRLMFDICPLPLGSVLTFT